MNRIEPSVPSALRIHHAAAPRPVPPLPSASPLPRVRLAAVVAGVVPGRVDFTGPVPTPDSTALPLYRHPADRNAAATSVHAGRLLDVVV